MSYQELQPAQQAVQPGLQGTQLRLQGPQGRAPRSAQPLYMAQVGEQVGSQPCQHTWELGHRAGGHQGTPATCLLWPPIPRTPSMPRSHLCPCPFPLPLLVGLPAPLHSWPR